jgi:hypothetical protein
MNDESRISISSTLCTVLYLTYSSSIFYRQALECYRKIHEKICERLSQQRAVQGLRAPGMKILFCV